MKETDMKIIHEHGIGIYGVDTTYNAENLPEDDESEK